MRTIAINNFYKEDFEMLQKCTSTDKSREFIKYIWYDGEGNLVSTDGKKMFVLNVGDWAIGDELGTEKGKFIYDKGLLIEMNVTLDYPEFKRVMRDTNKYGNSLEFEQFGKYAPFKTANRGIQLLIDLSMRTGIRLNADLAEIFKLMVGRWTVYYENGITSLTLKNTDHRTLIIMPMQRYWDED